METSELAKQYDKVKIGNFTFAATAVSFWAQYALSCADAAKGAEGKPLVIIKQIDSSFVMEIMADGMNGKILTKQKQQIVMHSHITYYKAVQPGYELQPGEKWLSVGTLTKI